MTSYINEMALKDGSSLITFLTKTLGVLHPKPTHKQKHELARGFARLKLKLVGCDSMPNEVLFGHLVKGFGKENIIPTLLALSGTKDRGAR